MFSGVIMAIVLSTAAKAQSVDSVTINGFFKILHCHKVMTLVCQPQRAGYIDSNQIKSSHTYKYTSRTEFHTKTAYEHYSESLTEKRVKTTADLKGSISYGAASASAEAGYETDYLSKLMSTVKTNQENGKDEIKESTEEYQIEYEPHKAIQLYECVVSVPGEYERVYASPKVPNQSWVIPYDIVVDYTNAVHNLFGLIKDLHVGTDAGEWGFFNETANNAFAYYGPDKTGALRSFLVTLKVRTWTNGLDQDSWGTVKTAAAVALGWPQPIDQFRSFCARITQIANVSHNDWAWQKIIDYARNYE